MRQPDRWRQERPAFHGFKSAAGWLTRLLLYEGEHLAPGIVVRGSLDWPPRVRGAKEPDWPGVGPMSWSGFEADGLVPGWNGKRYVGCTWVVGRTARIARSSSEGSWRLSRAGGPTLRISIRRLRRRAACYSEYDPLEESEASVRFFRPFDRLLTSSEAVRRLAPLR